VHISATSSYLQTEDYEHVIQLHPESAVLLHFMGKNSAWVLHLVV